MSKERIKNKIEELKRRLIFWMADYIGKSADALPQELSEALLEKLNSIVYWLTKRKMKAMVKRLCLEEGLTQAETRLIMSVIDCESGFDPWATHRNNGTCDWGICQYNDYYYRSLIYPDVALKDPERAVRLMIKQYRKGKLKDWVCYKGGYYKDYLNNVY